MICPYCLKPAEWCNNKKIYGRTYGKSYMVYYCKPCDARVGCHENTREPLGTMANKELREWRIKAHESMDSLWKSGMITRKEMYDLLNKSFGRQIHVGESDIKTCKEIIKKTTPLKIKK